MFLKLLILSSLLYFDVSRTASALQSNALFTCNNGNSIPIEKFCDGNQDCDGSDENMTSLPHNKSKTTISCETFPNLFCEIDVGYLCNNSVTCEGFDPCDAGCHTHYRCKNNTCVERTTICNGNKCDGCEEEDGWETGIGFQCIKNGMSCRIPQQLLYDDVQDCDEEDDICFSTAVETFQLNSASLLLFNQSRCFICLDRTMIVPRHKVCDGVIDCSDLSDECLCERAKVPAICQRVVGLTTYPQGNGKECKVGQVVCEDGGCIERTSVCDSNVDCMGHEDERYSYCKGTLPCRYGKQENAHQACRCNATCGTTIGVICNGVGDCPDPINDEIEIEIEKKDKRFPFDDECNAQCSASISFGLCSSVFPFSTKDVLPIRCNSKMLSKQFGSSKGRVSIVMSQKCDGIYDCDDGSDESNITCPERFLCPYRNKERISIDRRFVCDGHINCDDQADEVNCTDDGRFYCENKVPLFVTKQQIFDGRTDCSDESDECPLTVRTNENVLSSRYQLISNPILRTVLWVLGFLALLGNAIVIFGETRSLRNGFKTSGSPARTTHMLVFNLATADFLMGVYLIMLGIAGVVYEGDYCRYRFEWLSSTTCTSMGVLVMLSSEASVMTMVLLTSCRGYAVIRPFNATVKPTTRTLLCLIGVTWMLAFTLALIPLFEKLQFMFSEAHISDNPFFEKPVVKFDSAKSWAKKAILYGSSDAKDFDEPLMNIESAASWKELTNAVQHLNMSALLEVKAYFGYYSLTSACTPRFFLAPEDAAFGFSLFVTAFNFTSFMYIMFVYMVIIFCSRKTEDLSSNAGQRNSRLQRKVGLLLLTDFCCWIPLSITAFLKVGGVFISDEVYAYAAIILLPINSALNPFLYSNFLGQIYITLKQRYYKIMSSNSAFRGGAAEMKFVTKPTFMQQSKDAMEQNDTAVVESTNQLEYADKQHVTIADTHVEETEI